MNQSTSPLHPNKRIAFVQACWHQEIVSQAKTAFIDSVCASNIDPGSIDQYDVPGSLEIPLQCKLLAKSGDYQIIVAAGLIVDGGIYRHDFVASTVLDAMMQIQLETEVPVLSVVLTPHHFTESEAHREFFYQHFKTKGNEAAQACIQTLKNMTYVKSKVAA